MVVTRSSTTAQATRTETDGKDFGSQERCVTRPIAESARRIRAAIYIRPFCIDSATFRGDETAIDRRDADSQIAYPGGIRR